MDIKTCRKCGNLFKDIYNLRVCMNCRREEEEKFDSVRQYINELDRPVTMNEICEETGVSRSTIERWVREERLYFTKNVTSTIECERCGKKIITGRMCNDCKLELIKLVKEGKEDKQYKKNYISSDAKMRYKKEIE